MTKKITTQEAVAIINSIKDRYPELRQKSKSVSFASLYGGTYHTLVKNCGLSLESAKQVETNYHDLYKVSDAWKQTNLEKATQDGHATVAFGLRVRTPLLKQVMWNTGTVPYEAQAESRTAGNAMGQSYGLLTNRATNAFMAKVWESKYCYSILPIAQIHDATYFLIKNDLEVIEWANNHLIEEMEWQELPEIQHPQVHLGAALDVFKEGWHKPITLPNRASINEITSLLA